MLLLTALFVTACATPEQRAASMQAEMDRMMQIYGPACAKLGFAANSDQWRGCVLQLSAKDDMERYGRSHYYAGYARPHWRFGGGWGPYW
ncbi:hypothetical protein HHL21_14345 [Massilia sp. RP-1-19]|uniref:Uncharacterized protein n=2 Tax=Massilia polaris TaxID=2728846 RepID=A0A848HLY8_9BURK|nr:hypothetical protein [Massilia polaris]